MRARRVRPKLLPATLQDQVESVLRAADWHVETSDKGIYFNRSAELFGGPAELVNAIADSRAALLTAFLASDGPGWKLDGRRYLNLADLRAVHQATEPWSDPETVAHDADATLQTLEDAGALVRGLVLRCVELDVVSPDGVSGDIDILIADGSELWLGQATVQDSLGEKTKELQRLSQLREAARLLSARGVLLITAETWKETTRARAEAAFQGIWPRLEFIENGRQAGVVMDFGDESPSDGMSAT